MIFFKRRRALEAEVASLRRQLEALNYLPLRVAVLEAAERERSAA